MLINSSIDLPLFPRCGTSHFFLFFFYTLPRKMGKKRNKSRTEYEIVLYKWSLQRCPIVELKERKYMG
jgi:hypothetical protein